MEKDRTGDVLISPASLFQPGNGSRMTMSTRR
jgi:hypothetical protein